MVHLPQVVNPAKVTHPCGRNGSHWAEDEVGVLGEVVPNTPSVDDRFLTRRTGGKWTQGIGDAAEFMAAPGAFGFRR